MVLAATLLVNVKVIAHDAEGRCHFGILTMASAVGLATRGLTATLDTRILRAAWCFATCALLLDLNQMPCQPSMCCRLSCCHNESMGSEAMLIIQMVLAWAMLRLARGIHPSHDWWGVAYSPQHEPSRYTAVRAQSLIRYNK